MENSLDNFLENRKRYKAFDYPRAYYPEIKNKKLPGGKTCGDCFYFDKVLKCSLPSSKLVRKDTDYCQWSENRFTEENPGPVLWLAPDEIKTLYPPKEDFFAGTKEELLLHEILERADYQCECLGIICDLHKGRCQVLHVRRGGKSPLLLQPKNAMAGHSLKNTEAMCAQCANANTLYRMAVPRKKKNDKPDENQTVIL